MKTLTVDLGSRSYPIFIGAGALQQLPSLPCMRVASSIVIVTNTTVAPLYAAQVQNLITQHLPTKQLSTVTLPDGEAHKTAATLELIYTHLLAQRCDRKTLIIALGGGVVGDMAGFAAATFMRGVPFVQIPTTLLAQVDSSVGGKTAINHPLGKNMIGAFYQPVAVLADTAFLSTLPAREISAGLAEIIKYGCILQGKKLGLGLDYQSELDFLSWCEANVIALRNLDEIALAHAVYASCAMKAAVVAADETEGEADIRALLNFGHTFGHAFEHALGYGNWLHGEAVGYGMVCAAHLSHHLGLIDDAYVARLTALVAACGLPVSWPKNYASKGDGIASVETILEAMQLDKKTSFGRLKFIVMNADAALSIAGDAVLAQAQTVDVDTVRTVLNALRSAK